MRFLPPVPRWFAAICLAAFVWPQCRAEGQEKAPRQWAILIAVKKHHDATLNLSYTTADAQSMKKVLVERAGLPKGQILEMVDDAVSDLQPLRQNIRRELPKFLAQIPPDDRVTLFFAGHGLVKDGVTYLVPADIDRQDLARTAIPIDELKQALVSCKAKVKFLILDCCHAGGAGLSCS